MTDGDEQHDQHIVEWDRHQVRNSDQFSPAVKKAMERFWRLLDQRKEKRT